jgi:hypothetical protein
VIRINGKQRSNCAFMLTVSYIPSLFLCLKGLLGTGDVRRKQEIKRYPKGIYVIFNNNVYINKDNLKQ